MYSHSQVGHSAGVVFLMRLRPRKSNSFVIKVVGALEMLFFLAADHAAVGLDFSVRIKRSLAITPRVVFELDVLCVNLD
jgi:hypothetical protein